MGNIFNEHFRDFYGTEALFKDDSGNWFSLVQLV